MTSITEEQIDAACTAYTTTDGTLREVMRAVISAAHKATPAQVMLTEQQKADRDLLLYGESFMLDGKHIPIERVTVRRTPKTPDFSGTSMEGA